MANLSVNVALLKATSHAKKGETKEARQLYESVLKSFPQNKRAQQGLAALSYPYAVASQEPPQSIINNMITHYNEGLLTVALELARTLTQQFPKFLTAWTILGAANKRLGKMNEAAVAFEKLVQLAPDNAEAHYNLGVILKHQEKLEEALTSYHRAIHLKPDYAAAYNNIGFCFEQQGKMKDAIEAYKSAVYLTPNNPEVYMNLGNAIKNQGNHKLAVEVYEKALELRPDYAPAHLSLCHLIKYKLGDFRIQIVEALLNNIDKSDHDKCYLHFALAKMNEDTENLSGAFNNYSIGGALRKKILCYDFNTDKNKFLKIKQLAQSVKQNALMPIGSNPEHRPIFILGMPRSGSTLVEQIISRHSLVHGAGELSLLEQFGCPIALGTKPANLQNVSNVRDSYLEKLAKASKGAPFVTDKMPQNFLYIGLICSAFPEAKIIHVKRNSAATCWSNFKHYFSASGLGYSYNLNDVVQYYKLYEDLMVFWGQMYTDRIYQCDYDQLTINQETETRNLISHLGLHWEDACLSPEENKRSVRTASQQQVRQKVYRGSSEEWRKYKPYLDGAFDALNT